MEITFSSFSVSSLPSTGSSGSYKSFEGFSVFLLVQFKYFTELTLCFAYFITQIWFHKFEVTMEVYFQAFRCLVFLQQVQVEVIIVFKGAFILRSQIKVLGLFKSVPTHSCDSLSSIIHHQNRKYIHENQTREYEESWKMEFYIINAGQKRKKGNRPNIF